MRKFLKKFQVWRRCAQANDGVDEFVPKKDIDELYLRDPYFIVPDGEVGQQAFAVIRDAIRKEGMVALGKVVFTTREHITRLGGRQLHVPCMYFDSDIPKLFDTCARAYAGLNVM